MSYRTKTKHSPEPFIIVFREKRFCVPKTNRETWRCTIGFEFSESFLVGRWCCTNTDILQRAPNDMHRAPVHAHHFSNWAVAWLYRPGFIWGKQIWEYKMCPCLTLFFCPSGLLRAPKIIGSPSALHKTKPNNVNVVYLIGSYASSYVLRYHGQWSCHGRDPQCSSPITTFVQPPTWSLHMFPYRIVPIFQVKNSFRKVQKIFTCVTTHVNQKKKNTSSVPGVNSVGLI